MARMTMRPFGTRGARRWPGAIAALLVMLVSLPGCAQQERDPQSDIVTPQIKGKSFSLDVPFVPSHDNVLKAMFEMAKPTPDDFIIDLGSGDGRIVIAAARDYGARGFGVDLNEELVRIANLRARQAGVADRAEFHVRNLFETDISRATILTMYLLPRVVLELRPKLLHELRPGTRVLSHDYHLGDWRPDQLREVDIGATSYDSVVYMWVVPAEVSGVWEWELRHDAVPEQVPAGYAASIAQDYQAISGRARIGRVEAPLHDARLEGTRIRFSITGEIAQRSVRHDFDGTVEGDRISGTVRLSGGISDATLPWEARRTGAVARP